MDGRSRPDAAEEVCQCHPHAVKGQVTHTHDKEHEKELEHSGQYKEPNHRHQHAVLFRQMSKRDTQVDEQHTDNRTDQQPSERLQSIEQRIRVARKRFPYGGQDIAQPHKQART